MKLRYLGLLVMTVCSAGVALAAQTPSNATTPISAEQAATTAVNRLEPTADGVLLHHPRRTVEFAPEGVRLTSRRGAPEWRWSLDAITTADGAPIPARFEVGPMTTRIVVDGSALLTAAYPVTIDPEIGSNDGRISDRGPVGDPAYDAGEEFVNVAFNSQDHE